MLRKADYSLKRDIRKHIVNQRNSIEGTFGTGKRVYGLDCIRARRSDTSTPLAYKYELDCSNLFCDEPSIVLERTWVFFFILF